MPTFSKILDGEAACDSTGWQDLPFLCKEPETLLESEPSGRALGLWWRHPHVLVRGQWGDMVKPSGEVCSAV